MSLLAYCDIKFCVFRLQLLLQVLVSTLLLLSGTPLRADVSSAMLAMENPANPLFRFTTSRGTLYLELFPAEAPENVANFMALAEGKVTFQDPVSNSSYTPRYYNGMRFHRIIPGFVIQAGSPHYHPLGFPERLLRDEINAGALGLDRLTVLADDGSINPILNITDQDDLTQRILDPLYAQMNINSLEKLKDQQSQVLISLQSLTVMQLYQYEGFSYQSDFPTRGFQRGTVAMANDGPGRNGPEFFITLADTRWLNGRYTIIGRVVEGMEIADSIGSEAVNPATPDPASPYIYAIQRAN
ncbi:MAG: peptidylprolyl isomerase [Gammaproteobacteria bacterium]|nr:peptidylprolyl isomerase [Gammaproteobacteria bacterium]